MIRRINVIGGPGIGKSVFSANLFTRFKAEGYSAELCHEYVKDWVYQNRKVESFDQIYIFGKQMQKEFLPLKAGVQVVITDCPLFLSYYYSMELGNDERVNESIFNLVKSFDLQFPSINVLLERVFPFEEGGRYHDELASLQIDHCLKSLLEQKEEPYMFVDPSDEKSITAIFDEFLYYKWRV